VLSATTWLMCDLAVYSHGLLVYHVLILPVLLIGFSLSNTGTSFLGVFCPQSVPDMLNDSIYIEQNQHSVSKRITTEKIILYNNFVTLNETVNQPYYLSQEKAFRTFPPWLFTVVNPFCRFKNNRLYPELLCYFFSGQSLTKRQGSVSRQL